MSKTQENLPSIRIDILTLFPEMFASPLEASLIGKAQKRGRLRLKIHDLRDFTRDKHRTADDRPFGGGPGMVMKVEPIYRALKKLKALPGSKAKEKPHVVYLSPQGTTLSQPLARKLSGKKHLVLICGHYEGVDARALRWVDAEISIGDYVLTGGELPAMVLVDAVTRLVPGVVKEEQSVVRDSFTHGLLDADAYTRPAKFRRLAVPPVLLSGDHGAIELWRAESTLHNTRRKRPDLLRKKDCRIQTPQIGNLLTCPN